MEISGAGKRRRKKTDRHRLGEIELERKKKVLIEDIGKERHR